MPRTRAANMTNRDQQVLDFIRRYKRLSHGVPPTIREIKENCRISSTSMVEYYLRRLEQMGEIERIPYIRTRNIRVRGERYFI